MNEEVAVTFSLDELWLLHTVIRHESDNSRTWKFPSSGLELNDRIAEAILVCEETPLPESALDLSRGDCLCIDANVNVGMKDAYGKMAGKSILLKVFAARRTLSGGIEATAQEPELPDVTKLMEEFNARPDPSPDRPKRKPRRSAVERDVH